MKCLKEIDSQHHTVIMVQVENEIGMLPSARDYHPAATTAFYAEVPGNLISYLKKNEKNLLPETTLIWGKNGKKTKGNWPEIFGNDSAGEELFMAWYFGKYVEEIAAAGKKEYPLLMYVNAALNRPGWLPGQYPSAGPLPHLIDIWKAASPSIDFLAPDIYFADFKKWVALYDRGGNPLFLPEVRYESFSGNESYEPACGPKAFYAIGKHNALGFSPFFIESTTGLVEEPITESYKILDQLSPLIFKQQGNDLINGFLFDKNHWSDTIQLGAYTIIAKHDFALGWSPEAKEEIWPISGGIIICVGEGEYFVVGEGIVLTFPRVNNQTFVGIETIEEGSFENGQWKAVRNLNGDQSHQGRHLRLVTNKPGIQYLKLYQFQ